MIKVEYKLPILLLAIFVVLALVSCEQMLLPPAVEKPSVEPPGGPFAPPDLNANQQALLVAQQSLNAGEETAFYSQLSKVNSLLERLGEQTPPGPGALAAPPRIPLRQRLSAQRALKLSRPAPIPPVGNINMTVDDITFTGTSSVDGATNLVKAKLQGVSPGGTDINIDQTYSRNPDDFSYHLAISGKIAQDGVIMSYDIKSDYTDKGNGGSNFDFKISAMDGSDKTSCTAQLIVSGGGLEFQGAEAVSRGDGFWTVINYEGILNADASRITDGNFEFKASNGYTGNFALQRDGAAEGIIKDAEGKLIANLSVNPLGDLTIIYADGSGQDIVE